MDDRQVQDLALEVQARLTEMFMKACTEHPSANLGALLAIFLQGTTLFLATSITKMTNPDLDNLEAADRANLLCEQLVAAQRGVLDSQRSSP